MRGLAVVCLVIGSCRSPGSVRLPAAGTAGDDGVGVLAQASARFEFAGADEFSPTSARSYDQEPGDPLAGYGAFGYGGFGYGGANELTAMLRGLGGWQAPPQRTTTYQTLAIGDTGTIEGAVTWSGSAGIASPADCAVAPAVRGAPVADAIVYLERIASGREAPLRSAGVVTANRCGLWPPVQVVGAAPAVLTLENRRDAELATTVGGETATGEANPVGPGGRREVVLEHLGLIRVAAPALASAWLMVVPHPYYAVTDDTGRFALGAVPAGTYTLVVWHPPIAVASDGGTVQWSAPLTMRRSVTLAPNGTAALALALAPTP